MNAEDRYDSLLQFYADVRRLDWKLLKRQMLAESGGDPNAVSPAGAAGLMQFMRATWAEVALGEDPHNPEASIRAAARYMARLVRRYNQDYARALAAYNWGMGNLDHAITKYGGMWRTALPAETAAYLARILPGSR